MDVFEAGQLCKFIRDIVPSQAFDADTAAAWSLILADVDLGAARFAVIRVARTQRSAPFIYPADIIGSLAAEARVARAADVAGVDRVTPNVDPDDVDGYRLEWRALIAAQAGDRFDPEAYERGGWTQVERDAVEAAREAGGFDERAYWASGASLTGVLPFRGRGDVLAIEAGPIPVDAATAEAVRRMIRPLGAKHRLAPVPFLDQVKPPRFREPEAPMASVTDLGAAKGA